MKDILQEIIAHKRIELEQMKSHLSPHELYERVENIYRETPSPMLPSMREALLRSDSGIIAEFKRKSPSKGWIKEEGKAEEIPLSYQQHGASAISILTDNHYFGGSDDFISKARNSGVTLPILYKNFIIDEYQLFQARLCGASAVLLIAADLSLPECKTLLTTAHELGLEVLLEMHSESELDYADLLPDLYGVNNRNLGTFFTDVENSFRMASYLPADGCKVSESGISNPETVRDLRLAGFCGFLIGETFMKSEFPGESLHNFITMFKQTTISSQVL